MKVSKNELKAAVRILSQGEKPCFIDVHVRQGIRNDMPKLDINHHLYKFDLLCQFRK